jgi:hypothetical protein
VVSRDDAITVLLGGGSSQRIEFTPSTDGKTLRARSVIATPRILESAHEVEEEPVKYAWVRNRFSDLLGFTIDGRGRLVGETWIPLDELTSEEFRVYVEELARVCDWHEFRLTGQDEY